MSRLASRFEQLRASGHKALIPFVTAGDPHRAVTVPLMHALVVAGADAVELGVPFSDPMADGPVIQRASERALVHHTSLRDVLDMVREFRQGDAKTPVVLMGYLNPIEVMGYQAFAAAAARAGVDGVLTVDLPPDEGHDLLVALRAVDVDPIYLIAPTSSPARIEKICSAASGFVYYVSLKGVTGAAHLDLGPVEQKLAMIRQRTTLPVGVGFGIRDAATAARVARVADAVIVGSALVSRIEDLAERPDEIAPALAALLGEMRSAMDAA
jgi:tryptophan synthase alpha chain